MSFWPTDAPAASDHNPPYFSPYMLQQMAAEREQRPQATVMNRAERRRLAKVAGKHKKTRR